MSCYRSFLCVCVCHSFLLIVAGCGGLEAPSVDPQAAAARAMELYDTDANRFLSESELESCPPLRTASYEYDLDGDNQISVEEIVERLDSMYNSGVALTMGDCKVWLDRKPLPGATVRYVPDPFLGNVTSTAEGVTDQLGYASLAMPDEKLPDDQRGRMRMQVGLYRVEITHPEIDIPAKYNTSTELGFELHPYSHEGSSAKYFLTRK